jgi:hypothetical protein
MHYWTPAVNYLELPDAFLERFDTRVERVETSEAAGEDLLGTTRRRPSRYSRC